eukprot:PhM_4_TR9944/c0_g1_i1/m.51532
MLLRARDSSTSVVLSSSMSARHMTPLLVITLSDKFNARTDVLRRSAMATERHERSSYFLSASFEPLVRSKTVSDSSLAMMRGRRRFRTSGWTFSAISSSSCSCTGRAMSLRSNLRSTSVSLLRRASISASAPRSPMWLLSTPRTRSVVLTLRASAMACAPTSPIVLLARSSTVSFVSLFKNSAIAAAPSASKALLLRRSVATESVPVSSCIRIVTDMSSNNFTPEEKSSSRSSGSCSRKRGINNLSSSGWRFMAHATVKSDMIDCVIRFPFKRRSLRPWFSFMVRTNSQPPSSAMQLFSRLRYVRDVLTRRASAIAMAPRSHTPLFDKLTFVSCLLSLSTSEMCTAPMSPTLLFSRLSSVTAML